MLKTDLFHPFKAKDTGIILPLGMRNWILPPWFRDQNNPLKINYMAGKTAFYNYSNRSWTSLRANPEDGLIQVDSFGIIYLEKLKISIEIWVYHETKLYTPGTYTDLTQKFSAANGTIDINMGLKVGCLSVTIGPMLILGNSLMGIQINRSEIRQSVPEPATEFLPQSFEPIIVWLVARPFGPNGLAKIRHLEYKDRYLTVNHKKVLRFEDEPQHCFFTNAALGDVTQYFRLWEGNSKIEATDGSCTGILGFADIPANQHTIRTGIHDGTAFRYIFNKSRLFRGVQLFSRKEEQTDCLTASSGALQTGTKLDQLYKASIRHLATFCGKRPINIYQVLVLNRLGWTAQSRGYLKTALKKVHWDGSLANQYLSGECVIFAVADYYKITGDQVFIEKYWPVLKRVGLWLCYQSGLMGACSKTKPPQNVVPGRLERFLWLCGSLQAITELGTALAKNREVQIFKNHFFMVWTKLFDETLTGCQGVLAEPDHGHHPGGEMAIRGLMASFPLQLSEKGSPWMGDLLRRITAHHLWKGGFFSPQDFPGINLELTIRLGQALIREGMEYQMVLDFLLDTAGPTFRWPDRINPLSKEGIGEQGHDPEVLFQMLLMIRSLFLIEDSENLQLLPGIFISRFWQAPNLELINWPTFFGNVSLKVRTIGGIIQINFEPKFRRRPQKILLTFDGEYRLLYTDTNIQWNGNKVILDPDFQVLRVFNNARLDNTFGHTL